MLRKIKIAVLLALACCAFAMAAQRQVLKIVPDPLAIGVKAGSDTIRVDWIQLAGVGSPYAAEGKPKNTDIYFSRHPAAGDLGKYTKLQSTVSANLERTLSGINVKYSSFVPDRQGGAMGPGAYYCIVAAVEGTDTLYSDYFQVMVESPTPPAITHPVANPFTDGMVKKITELTPRFSWKAIAGVPYYHVVLCDGPIFSMVNGEPVPNENLNVIWQAITPNTSIDYGSPDPSGTITANSPPLSRGKTYSWLVLNNFGNHMVFNSSKFNAADLIFGQFQITGPSISAPKAVSPANHKSFSNEAIKFEWSKNLASDTSKANSYLINVYSSAIGEDLGVEGLDLNAHLLIWETTVSGRDSSVVFDAPATLATGDYMWRVYAIDNTGTASTDSTSLATFKYNSNMGSVSLKTVEMIAGVVESPVGFVELKTEVISGPMQAPIGFYSDPSGDVSRSFPNGSYRFTTVKEGYNAQSVTVNVPGGSDPVKIYLTRPEAVIYGRVFAASDSLSVNLAKVTAISEWGDTVTTFTNGSGSYTLNCRAADWTVYVEKAGFRYITPVRTTLRLGDNKGMADVFLQANPFTLSGVVNNSDGNPVSGVKVRVLREGVLIEELPSTPQSGMYAFYLASGTYTLTAEKPGFTMFSGNVTVTGNRTQNITIRQGAVLVNGSIIGKTWAAESNSYVNAPITSARVRFEGAADTFTVTSDATFGKFSISLPESKDYAVRVEATSFNTAAYTAGEFSTDPALGATRTFTDTVYAFGTIRGIVKAAGGASIEGADVIVFDTAGGSDRVVATGRTNRNGGYEVRNIPNGAFRVGAGKIGYFSDAPYYITVSQGRPDPSLPSYDFNMSVGEKSIRWNIACGYAGEGSVKVISPLNRTIQFEHEDGSSAPYALLDSVGPGNYLIEAVAFDTDDKYELLQLSRRVTAVSADDSLKIDSIYFPLKHSYRDTLSVKDGVYSLEVDAHILNQHSRTSKVEVYYRSEGSAQFRSAVSANSSSGVVTFADGVRDGSNLYYYFIVTLENGDVYGSSKQIFTTYIKPDLHSVSRIAVEPSVLAGDTLYLPSSYEASFSFHAFYSDLYAPIGDGLSIGNVEWSIAGAKQNLPSSGKFKYTTPRSDTTFVLEAKLRLTPSLSYRMKAGVDSTVRIPVRITGAALDTLIVMRKGSGGPIHNTGETGFFVGALDAKGKSVTVTPQWSTIPASGAGAMSADGIFKPNPRFFGNVRIVAKASGKEAEYIDAGSVAPGLTVHYMLRRRSDSDTVNTLKGLSLAFPGGSVPAGEDVEFSVVFPELKNHVHKGSDGYRMADSVSFDVVCDMFHKIEGEVSIIIDVPGHLREAAKGGDQEFKVARWSTEQLTWIPIDSCELALDGSSVTARLSNNVSAAPSVSKNKAGAKKAAMAANAFTANALAANARYALVTKSTILSAVMSVSPHPFSPHIRPTREHGSDAEYGTRIKVSVEAAETYVRTIQIHIYNATGKRVWAVKANGSVAGDNIFWWNGRTSGKGDGRTSVAEEPYDENYNNSNKPLCRNGRYFVSVIVTDYQGRQKKLMKPVVLMK